jgi:hypothetical protein
LKLARVDLKHLPDASVSLFPKATYLSRSSSQKSSYRVLDSLRIFTKRNPVVFVHTSPMQIKTIASPLAAAHLIGAFIALPARPSSNESGMSAYALGTRSISVLGSWREELEGESGGDHDLLYTFTLPATWPQVLAWIRLLAKVHTGAIQL